MRKRTVSLMLEFHCNYKSIFPACSAAASYCALVLANSAILWLSSGADHARLPLQSVGAQASPDPVGSHSGLSKATGPSGAQVKQISGFPQTHFFFPYHKNCLGFPLQSFANTSDSKQGAIQKAKLQRSAPPNELFHVNGSQKDDKSSAALIF